MILCPLFNANSQQYNFLNYTIDDGLPGSSINSIFEDSRGFLWVGTNNGLSRFNGNVWKTYSTPEEFSFANIQTIYEDKRANLWIGTKNNGLFLIDGASVKKYYKSKSKVVKNLNIVSICEDENGNILIASKKNGLFILNLKDLFRGKADLLPYNSVNIKLQNSQINAMIKDSDNNIWIGSNKGLMQKKRDEISFYTLFNGLPHNNILNIFEDDLGRIWFSTPRGVVLYDFNSFSVFKVQQGLLSNVVNHIEQDKNGNIWFGTDQGISIFDGSVFSSITKLNGLSDKYINYLHYDSFGDMWIGTKFGGINKFSGYMISRLTTTEGLSNNKIFALSIDFNSDLYVASLNGIEKLNYTKNNKFKFEKIKGITKLESKIIKCIYVDNKNRKWIGTNKGVFISSKDEIKYFNAIDSVDVSVIYEDKDENIFIGTSNNLLKFKFINGNYSLTKFSINNNLPQSEISSIYQDLLGTIWIGYRNNGLFYSDSINHFTAFKKEKINNVTTIKHDKNNKIWVGTESNGVFIIKSNKNNKHKLIKNLGVKNGLISNRINSLLFLNEYYIIIGSNRGIDKFTIDKNYSIQNNKRLGYSEGFKQIETTERAIDSDTEGLVFIGSLNGLIIYNKYEDNFNLKPPKTHIKNIKLFFKNVNWKESEYCSGTQKWFNLPKNLILPPNQNHITFEFNSINLKPKIQTYYQWRLSPKNKDWSTPTTNTEITFSDLSSGDYVFQVRTYSDNGISNINSYNFIIQTPIYKTLWFISLALLLIAALIMLSMKLRTKKLMHDKQLLEKEVKKRTIQLLEEKELVENMNEQILLQSEQLELQRNSVFEINELLENKNKDITDSINYAKTIQSAVLGPKESIREIFKKSFVYYLPKDIVSGDFYWFSKENNIAFVAAVDCTGHGIPGAFMSIIGHSLIKEVINKDINATASEVLTQLDKEVIEALSLHQKDNYAKDGMDIALCKIDFNKKQINFSGANRPFYFLKKHSENIEVIKGNRIGIGDDFFDKTKHGYTNHFIDYEKGDRFYIFSDGLIDQFGGGNDKKFLASRFKKLVFLLKDKDIIEQENELHNVFKRWKGKNKEQADDILIIGIEM